MNVLSLNFALKLGCYDVRSTTLRMLVQLFRSNFLLYNKSLFFLFFFTDKQLRRPWQTPSKIYDVMHVSAGTTRRRRQVYLPFCASLAYEVSPSSKSGVFGIVKKKIVFHFIAPLRHYTVSSAPVMASFPIEPFWFVHESDACLPRSC